MNKHRWHAFKHLHCINTNSKTESSQLCQTKVNSKTQQERTLPNSVIRTHLTLKVIQHSKSFSTQSHSAQSHQAHRHAKQSTHPTHTVSTTAILQYQSCSQTGTSITTNVHNSQTQHQKNRQHHK